MILPGNPRCILYRHKILFQQGAKGDAAYVIIKGTADVLVDTPHGQVSIAKVERNDIIGEIAILCDDVLRTATFRRSRAWRRYVSTRSSSSN
jgi:CRP-like cAMP-binding protein